MKYSIYLGTPQGAGSQKKNCTRRDGRAGRPLMISRIRYGVGEEADVFM